MNSVSRKFLLPLCASLMLTGCLTLIGSPHSMNSTEDGPVQVLKTEELMKIMMDPVYEDLKDWIEVPPQRRKEWRGLYIAAFSIAELSNLMYARTGEEYTDSEEWTRLTTEARDIAIRLAESVREQAEYDILKQNYLAVVDSCNRCHERFDAEEPTQIELPRAWMEKSESPASQPF